LEQTPTEALDQIAGRHGDWHYGRELQARDEARAERLSDQALKAGAMGGPIGGYSPVGGATQTMPYTAVILISFLSGASCLVYELVWSRYLHLVFGVSVYAVATVLASFMLGLALGNWHLGRVIDRSRNPVRALLWLEAGIGVYIALSPLLYHGFSQITIHLFQAINPEGYLKHGIRFLIALAALLVPTYLMGGTFPAFIKIAARQPDRVGSDVGTIYAVNTLGGAAGAFLAGFFLIQAMGLSHTLFLAAGLNFAVALWLVVMLKKRGAGCQSVGSGEAPKRRRTDDAAPPPKLVGLTLAIFGLSGFTGLAYEVYWTRILTFFFKDSIYDFTIVLTTFLAGIVAGSLLCGRFIRNGRNTGFWFAVGEILIGLSSLAGLFLIGRFPYLINDLQTNTALVNQYGEGFWRAGTMIRFGYASLLMIVPTCLFGATFPLVSRIVAGNAQTLGRRIGLMNGINTLGATLGSIMAGFVFISWLGLQKSIVLTALANIVAGLVLLAAIPLVRARLKWALAVGTAALTLVAAGLLPGWDKLRMSTSFLDQHQPLEDLLSLEFYREDASGMTSVVELKPLHRKYLVSNRLYGQNSSDLMGLEDHRRLGHIPMLLHPHPQSALVIGLGAGMTLRGVSDHPVKTIDCVEIAPGVIEAAGYFGAENNHIVDNPRVHFIVDDGRSFVSTTRRKYDVIIMDILFPMSAGSSTVFSREYFERCKARLQPGGLVCQWLPVHQFSLEEIKIIVATFQSVFPHTSLWYGLIGESTAVVGCIGAEQPLAIDFAKLAEACREPLLVKELREVNLGNPDLLLSSFIAADGTVSNFCRGRPLNTDDRPLIEFLAPKLAVQSSRQGRMNLLELSRLVEDVAPHINDRAKIFPRDSLQRRVAGKAAVIEGYRLSLDENADGQLAKYREALAQDPANEDLQDSIKQLAAP
jgi:spermidine synthase